MRNLAKYPVTADEICAYLEGLGEEIRKEGNIGDMRPLLLQEAAAAVKQKNDFNEGFEAAIREAIKVCTIATEAFNWGAGSAHSEEARQVAKAQAEWCRDNIATISSPTGRLNQQPSSDQ